ncbi:hypothetical protein GCM10023196_042630 [Actinoallomurus vinaceus]|uniref:Uncharacterized protein n=1 Tax=Actinoallomurus vinaceus TaxID=1080074 RepID=A0ABP8UE56_9ACTN
MKALCQAFYMPAPVGLDRGFVAFVGDVAGHFVCGEFVADFRRVVAGVQMHGDVCGQRAQITEFIQGGGQ